MYTLLLCPSSIVHKSSLTHIKLDGLDIFLLAWNVLTPLLIFLISTKSLQTASVRMIWCFIHQVENVHTPPLSLLISQECTHPSCIFPHKYRKPTNTFSDNDSMFYSLGWKCTHSSFVSPQRQRDVSKYIATDNDISLSNYSKCLKANLKTWCYTKLKNSFL